MREDNSQVVSVRGVVPPYGRVWVFDDMESLFKWAVVPARHSPWVGRDQTHVFNGDYALRFWSGSITPNGAVSGVAYRSLARTSHGLVRLECVHYRDSPASVFSVAFGIKLWDGSYITEGYLRWAGGTPLWRYYDENGDWLGVGSSSQILASGAWHRVAVELDVNRVEYRRLESNGMVKDLSGLGMRRVASGVEPVDRGVILMVWTAGPGKDHYFDDVLVMEV